MRNLREQGLWDKVEGVRVAFQVGGKDLKQGRQLGSGRKGKYGGMLGRGISCGGPSAEGGVGEGPEAQPGCREHRVPLTEVVWWQAWRQERRKAMPLDTPRG